MKFEDESKLEQCSEELDRIWNYFQDEGDGKELTPDQYSKLDIIYGKLYELRKEVVPDEL